MKSIKKQKCLHCKALFRPDKRNYSRQKFCSKEDCRRVSKKHSQNNWSQKPENQNYFRCVINIKRVQSWRQLNPGYWKKKKEEIPLQDIVNTERVKIKEVVKSDLNMKSFALQDSINHQLTFIIGFVAFFTGDALQDSIEQTIKKFIFKGENILNNHQKKLEAEGAFYGKEINLSTEIKKSTAPI